MTNQEAIRILDEQRNKFMDEWVDFGGVNEAYNMAIALLKNQEAVKPFSDDDGGYWCSSCHEDIVWHQKFCSNCGRPVLWEGR